MKSSIRNEIKAQIIRAGYTMQEVVDLLHDEYGWSDSVSNLSGKLQRESLRYRETVEWLTCWDMTLSGRNGGIEYGKAQYAIMRFAKYKGLKSAISRPITSAQRKSTPVIPMWIPAEASTTSIWSNRPASTGPSQRGKLPLPDAVPGKTVSV